jgi:hypothetical protein
MSACCVVVVACDKKVILCYVGIGGSIGDKAGGQSVYKARTVSRNCMKYADRGSKCWEDCE